MWGDDPALDSVLLGASTQDEFVAGVLDWLEWPEEKRIELGARFRSAVLQDHCGASWKRKWLDPAINALISSGDIHLDLLPEDPRRKALGFPGLGIATPEYDWPTGMFVAGIIDSYDFAPLPIRISGVFHSIKPLLFHTPGDGTTRRRISLFTWLVASCMPDQVRTAPRRILRAIFKKPRNRRESAD